MSQGVLKRWNGTEWVPQLGGDNNATFIHDTVVSTTNQTGIGSTATEVAGTGSLDIGSGEVTVMAVVYCERKTAAGHTAVSLRSNGTLIDAEASFSTTLAVNDRAGLSILFSHTPGAGARTYEVYLADATGGGSVDKYTAVLTVMEA